MVIHVYVMGAGGSVHLGAPLMRDFVTEGFLLFGSPEIYDFSEDSYLLVAEFVDKVFDPGFLRRLTEARNRNEITCPSVEVNIEELMAVCPSNPAFQSAVYDFIFETLDSTTKGAHSDVYTRNPDGTFDHRRNCYDKLVEGVIDAGRVNCVISLNYDLFLDSALMINQRGLLPDYGLDFAHYDGLPGYLERLQRSTVISLLKLHGSLNWGRCPKCESLTLFYHRDYRGLQKESCKTCSTKLQPVLVPPGPGKSVPVALQSIWARARSLVAAADHITVIGYSFPDTDVQVRGLFEGPLTKGKKPNIVVVDPDDRTLSRLCAILEPFSPNITCLRQSFEAFVEAVGAS
jgi:hypothetical protein